MENKSLTSECRKDPIVLFTNSGDERDEKVDYRNPEILKECFQAVMQTFPDYKSITEE
jgi:hypothetical protein